MSAASNDILLGLDGAPLGLPFLSKALTELDGRGRAVTSVEVVSGSEKNFPTSHSAILSLSCGDGGASTPLFVKKVSAEAMKHKAWQDRRRTLAYSRTEMRFYREFASTLSARGVCLPRLAATMDLLGPLLGNSEVADPPGDEPPAHVLAHGGGLLLIECASPTLTQCSPISFAQAGDALACVARLHAAAWADVPLLSSAAARLQRFGGSFSLRCCLCCVLGGRGGEGGGGGGGVGERKGFHLVAFLVLYQGLEF